MPRCTIRVVVLTLIGTVCTVLLVYPARLQQLSSSAGYRSSSVSPLKILADSQQKNKECICEPLKKENLPPLYIIMPTYPRAEQIPELTRFTQTLMHVPNIFLIVSEDSKKPTKAVESYLVESGIPHTYLRVEMPSKYNKMKKKPRGVANRLAGMDWIRQNARTGVFYFADDDNTYDIRIFEEIRTTKKVSVFPVGLVAERAVSTPVVKDGKVTGFYDGWVANRKFPLDMAGFAVNVEFFLKQPNATMPYKPGYEEDGFLLSLGVTPDDLEPKAFNCTKIWVWHTQTKKNGPLKGLSIMDSSNDTNLSILRHVI
ncbi:galactosylgalactosylxylosylprotein 3-beta-glucuronosyltransferase S-like [Oratosquilla oratoria]|uniref:galactosylgalactosylxylosylprotein 3-beta-glucuronosyltransferase S-like n=1 Tax=Oratosquilla oratoria TaxID=337810 RepID=UPI003F7763F8